MHSQRDLELWREPRAGGRRQVSKPADSAQLPNYCCPYWAIGCLPLKIPPHKVAIGAPSWQIVPEASHRRATTARSHRAFVVPEASQRA